MNDNFLLRARASSSAHLFCNTTVENAYTLLFNKETQLNKCSDKTLGFNEKLHLQ